MEYESSISGHGEEYIQSMQVYTHTHTEIHSGSNFPTYMLRSYLRILFIFPQIPATFTNNNIPQKECLYKIKKRQRKPKGHSGMDNPETLVAQATQDTGQINVRENRRDNQVWTIQRHYQHWAHKTQDK